MCFFGAIQSAKANEDFREKIVDPEISICENAKTGVVYKRKTVFRTASIFEDVKFCFQNHALPIDGHVDKTALSVCNNLVNPATLTAVKLKEVDKLSGATNIVKLNDDGTLVDIPYLTPESTPNGYIIAVKSVICYNNDKLKAHIDDQSTPTVPCSSLNLRKVKVGQKCMTSSGYIYERVSKVNFGQAWKGQDNLIWSSKIGGLSSQKIATQTCKDIGGDLPSLSQFMIGEGNEFSEVLPDIRENWFWTSTIDSHIFDDDSSAFAFAGGNASGGSYSRDSHYFSILCVGK